MRARKSRDDNEEITVARIEKCLDRLAVIMTQDREIAPRLAPMLRSLVDCSSLLERGADPWAL
jgi:hypothetical protein